MRRRKFWVEANDPLWGWVGRWAISITVAALSLLTPQAGVAQRARVVRDLPDALRSRVEALLEDPDTDHFEGDTRIHTGVRTLGHVAVIDGDLRVDGVIGGDVLVLGGDLHFGPDGRVEGNATVVDGRAAADAYEHVGGTLTEQRTRSDLRSDARTRSSARSRSAAYRGSEWDEGRTRAHASVTGRIGPTYNRVEGLPVWIGPMVRTSGPAPLLLEALGIWRTATGFDAREDELGYWLRLEQRFGRRSGPFVGARVYSVVNGVEDWSLSDAEASLATLLLRDDFRDYYAAEGWSGYVGMRAWDQRLRLTLDYRREDHGFASVADPWTLGDDDELWRAQPLVAEGRISTVGAEVVAGDTDDRDRRHGGWFVRAEARKGVDGTLVRPVYTQASGSVGAPRSFAAEDLAVGFVDLRRYAPLGPDARLDVRVLAGGSLNDRSLPAQFQHAFGGAGSLPGYRLFAGDCGARTSGTAIRAASAGSSEPVFLDYGCDRFAALQVEYRGGLSFDFQFSDGRDEDPDNWGNWEDWDDGRHGFDASFEWSLFFDVARGWLAPDSEAPGRAGTDTLMDAGAGVWFGGLGVLAAVPLDSEEHPVRFLIRLEQRF